MFNIIILSRFSLIIFLLPIISASAFANEIYQTPEDFIEEVFAGHPPDPNKLWITKDIKQSIRNILEHDLGVLRLRYWSKDGRSAWILEEIGKERPITTGIVVNQGHIEIVRILIFRETRGWEVRYPFFTDQFNDAGLVNEDKLDKSIDGISGATLSVNAVTKLARLALLLHEYAKKGKD